MRAHIIFATALLVMSTAHAVEVYRWVDKDGKVHYGDQPPPSSVKDKDMELKKLGTNAIEVDKLSYATRDAAKKNPVTLYANNCGVLCDSARQLLAKRGIPFVSKNPESSKADSEALTKVAGGLEVPVLVVGTNISKGFNADVWDAALDAAGYSKSGVLPSKPDVKSQPAAVPQPDPTPQPAVSERTESKPVTK
ncbi:MAG: glutaredoxin family protein [Pseudomonadota bacterium]